MASSGITSLVLLVLAVIVGFIMDYPTQKKKQMQRDEDCKNGKHDFEVWQHDYDIGYNSKDVYQRRCKNCRKQQFTISRLHPLDDDVTVYEKL